MEKLEDVTNIFIPEPIKMLRTDCVITGFERDNSPKSDYPSRLYVNVDDVWLSHQNIAIGKNYKLILVEI